LIATPDYETAVLGSNPVISPAYSGLQSLDGLPSGMALCCRLSFERRQRGIEIIGTYVPPKTIKKKILSLGLIQQSWIAQNINMVALLYGARLYRIVGIWYNHDIVKSPTVTWLVRLCQSLQAKPYLML
jgi:hypothetical protein